MILIISLVCNEKRKKTQNQFLQILLFLIAFLPIKCILLFEMKDRYILDSSGIVSIEGTGIEVLGSFLAAFKLAFLGCLIIWAPLDSKRGND